VDAKIYTVALLSLCAGCSTGGTTQFDGSILDGGNDDGDTRESCEAPDQASFYIDIGVDDWGSLQDTSFVYTASFDGQILSCSGTPVAMACSSEDIGMLLYRYGVGGDSPTTELEGIKLFVFPGTVELLIEQDGVRIVEELFEGVAPSGPCSSWFGEFSL